MSLLSKKAVVLLLTAVASLGALNAQAAKATASDAFVHAESLDAGRQVHLHPAQGLYRQPAAGQRAAPARSGTMYTNETTKTVVIAAENNLPRRQRQRQRRCSFSTVRRPISTPQQRKALPDFNKLSEKSLTQKATGLGLRRSTAPPPKAAA